MIKIRSPQITDLKNLEELFRESTYINLLLSNKVACLAQPLIPYNLRFLPSIHIAVEKNNIIGYIILECASKPNNCWQIQEVYVLDQLRNKGIGEELLRYVLSVYGGEGVEHFLAEVDSQNTPALSLFHECGFRRTAKVCFYKKEINTQDPQPKSSQLDRDFIIRPQSNADLNEIEKLELSSVPPDLRAFLGRSKNYFKQKKNSIVIIDKSRNIIIGWAQVEKISPDNYFIEIIASPGWTHLYKQFLETIFSDYVSCEENELKLTIKVIDYNTELTQILAELNFLPVEIKELLVRTIWQKVKGTKQKIAKFAVPRTAPT